MYFKEGDILYLNNTKFKDGILDSSIKGHPVLVLKIYNEVFYYLIITSNVKRGLKPLSYYKIYKDKNNKLRKDISFVNVKNIYYRNIDNYIARGRLKSSDYMNVLKNLKYFQENIKLDEEYTKLKKVL